MKDSPEKMGALRTGAIVLLLCVCWFAHFFPFDIIALIMWLPWWAYLSILTTLAMVRVILVKLPRALMVAAYFYYFLVSLYICLIGYYVWLLDPAYILFTLAFTITFALALAFAGDRRLVLIPFAAVILFFLIKLPHPVFKFGWILFLPFVIPGFALATPKQIGRAALIFAAVTALVTMRLGAFYYGADKDLLPKVLSQPGIEAVATIDDKSPKVLSKIGRHIRFAADNMAGTHTLIGGDAATLALDLKTNAAIRIMEGSSADNLVYVPKQKALGVGNYSTEELAVIDDASLKILRREKALGRSFTNLWFDPTGNRIITGDDKTRDIGIFDLNANTFLPFIKGSASRDALVDVNTGALIATTLRRVRRIDPASGLVTGELRPNCSQLRLEIDSEKRFLYVACFTKGELWRVNLDTFEKEKMVKLEPGIRFMKLSDDKTMLFLSSYFKGNIFQIKVPEMEVTKTIFAGPRVRSLHIAPHSGKVVFGSSLGVFRYNFR